MSIINVTVRGYFLFNDVFIGIIIDSHAIVRNSTVILTHFAQFPPMEEVCKTIE